MLDFAIARVEDILAALKATKAKLAELTGAAAEVLDEQIAYWSGILGKLKGEPLPEGVFASDGDVEAFVAACRAGS